jgi:hypothetical protein
MIKFYKKKKKLIRLNFPLKKEEEEEKIKLRVKKIS